MTRFANQVKKDSFAYHYYENKANEVENEKGNLMKAIRLLGCLPEDKINIVQYQSILESIFADNNNILNSLDSPNRSNLHRMIRIYDFLKYGPKKTP